MSSSIWCASCGRRLPDDRDEDGYLLYDYMCPECDESQSDYYDSGRAS